MEENEQKVLARMKGKMSQTQNKLCAMKGRFALTQSFFVYTPGYLSLFIYIDVCLFRD